MTQTFAAWGTFRCQRRPKNRHTRCYAVRASDGCAFRGQFSGRPSQATIDAVDAMIHAVGEHLVSPERT